MRTQLSRRVKAAKSYGQHIERLCNGHSVVMINNKSEAFNLKKFIKANMNMRNLVVEPQALNLFSLTWHLKPPKKTGETDNYLFFDLGDVVNWP